MTKEQEKNLKDFVRSIILYSMDHKIGSDQIIYLAVSAGIISRFTWDCKKNNNDHWHGFSDWMKNNG